MSTFVVANGAIIDHKRFDAVYRPLARKAREKFSSRILVANGVAVAGEGEFLLDRVGIIEFRDVETARAYIASAEFQAAKAKREGISRFKIVLLRGTDEPRIDATAPGYLLANTDLVNPAGVERHLKEWAPIGRATMQKYGGHVIGQSSLNFIQSLQPSGPPYPQHGGDPPEIIEGEWELYRVLLHEYPDFGHARGFVTSPEWVAGRPIRQACGAYNVVLLHGDSDPSGSLL